MNIGSLYRLIMKKILLIIICLSNTALFPQEISLKLNEAVNISFINNLLIKQYEEKYNQKLFDYKSTYGNFLPNLNFAFSYTHLNKDMDINLNPIRDVIINLQSSNQVEFTNISNIISGKPGLTDVQKLQLKNQFSSTLKNLIPDFQETFKEQNYYTGTFTITQPIFVGGKLLAANSFAYNELNSSKYELFKVKNDIALQTIDAYLKVILIQEIVSTRINVLNGIIKHKEKANKLFNEGLIAKHNLLRAEVALSEAERNLEKDKNNLALAIESFKTIINIDNKYNVKLNDSLRFISSSYNIDSLKSIAFVNHPIIKILELKKEASNDNYKIVRSEFLPSLFAFGKYEIYPEYLSSLEPRWAVGVQLNYNLFNGFKDYLKLQSAKHLQDEIDFVEKDVKSKIELQLTNAFLEIINKKNDYIKLISSLELAKENLRQNEKRFETGMGTSLEVIDAHLSLEKVELERSTILYQYYIALANLFSHLGNTQDFFKVWNN